MFCLDTNIAIEIMNRRAPRLEERLRAEKALRTRLFLPAVALFELRYGAAKSEFPARNGARVETFLLAVPEVAPFDSLDAAEAGAIRAQLEMRGEPIGQYDYLIAAQARRRGAALVTLNRREFERVPGLIVTDWAA
ncbi:MAG: PIN domain-containing protein [Roseiarcus sp.]|jgi:tRNA(fMet)-specific endonuclease VapC